MISFYRWTENRGQKTEVGRQMTEVGSGNSEVGKICRQISGYFILNILI